jgi:hypothetical protein
MPPLAKALAKQAQEAVQLARAGDIVAALPHGNSARLQWYPARVELLYELAYLRLFVRWEQFLEESFIRYLCGYVSSHPAATSRTGHFFGTLPQARAAMLGGKTFALWHNPSGVVSRTRSFLVGSTHESVVASNLQRLEAFGAVRHRIAHDQHDGRVKFDRATMILVGRRYRGSRPGRFLRDLDRTVTPPQRWLESVANELCALAVQIA